jgi:GT2 family glycosyltransferase
LNEEVGMFKNIINNYPLSHLKLANLAMKHKTFDKARWYYENIVFQYPSTLKKSIELNISIAKKSKKSKFRPIIEIIVPIYNGLEDLKKCLDSIKFNTKIFKFRVLLINDASNKSTTKWLQNYCAHSPIFYLIEHEKNHGYTKAINTGIKLSSAPYIILLNSDTIVSKNWLENLIQCMHSNKHIGIVGPLSNAATWQSIPQQRDSDGKFAINYVPHGFSIKEFAQWIEKESKKFYPNVELLNGFCMLIKREVINTIGYLDVENFPIGYGEETDYCIRAKQAGFALAIADDTYVYHSKSKSFGHERRIFLSKKGEERLKNKYGTEHYKKIKLLMKNNEELNIIRKTIVKQLNSKEKK